jgi:predicted extracellular nuclease
MKKILNIFVLSLFVLSCGGSKESVVNSDSGSPSEDVQTDIKGTYPDKERGKQGLRIGFYNLENLFNTVNDSMVRDEEFTPDGMKNWNDYRYYQKSNQMAQAIFAMGGWEFPAVVGLCELENVGVIEDLVQRDVIKNANYEIVHYESIDRRGIDVALIYRPSKFEVLYSKPYRIKLDGDPGFRTRDVLYVKGVALSTDTLHLFVNHWPSRYGGQLESEPKRMAAAQTVRAVVDSIYQTQPEAHVIIMGDLNDHPENKSISEVLRAGKYGLEENDLINLMTGEMNYAGSHRYRGEWSFLDHIIVSPALLDDTGIRVVNGRAWVTDSPLLLTDDNRYPGKMPFRTYGGPTFLGGFSDHLPIFIDLELTD